MPFVVAIQYHIYRYISDVSLSLSYCYSSILIPEDKQRANVHTGQHSSFYQCRSLYESTIYLCARTLASATPSTVTGYTTSRSSTATEHPSDVGFIIIPPGLFQSHIQFEAIELFTYGSSVDSIDDGTCYSEVIEYYDVHYDYR